MWATAAPALAASIAAVAICSGGDRDVGALLRPGQAAGDGAGDDGLGHGCLSVCLDAAMLAACAGVAKEALAEAYF